VKARTINGIIWGSLWLGNIAQPVAKSGNFWVAKLHQAFDFNPTDKYTGTFTGIWPIIVWLVTDIVIFGIMRKPKRSKQEADAQNANSNITAPDK